ncbi:hypothetical protein DIJ64_05840 [Mycobacterium leprae]|uniref:Uncharacterized protein n=1 Tax=Mycobacterium leprae TaxID=1769 RepID=A0AAD0P6Q2_MYCLR|nr:hypothetical protein [Mycobacterium leprae]AWV47767.1 hypothetical protein DIJ64_05840 [Mycobacterium leprae]OAR21201.1 hypothetical protein A8144_07475 [Mycobacterium leprae 3125609]OAX71093.1 hypothetical protein A3216_07905 [Mycobacterium leprae 7935681]
MCAAATIGAASLLGLLAGRRAGLAVDFFINVRRYLSARPWRFGLGLVLSTQGHRFDLISVGLSESGTFLIVFRL